MENYKKYNKKYEETLKITENKYNLILKYIDGDWYLLFGGSVLKESLNFSFFYLNILASTKKIEGCYLLDREAKSIDVDIKNRILSLNDIDPLKIHLNKTKALIDDAVFNKKQKNEFKAEEPNQEEFYRKGFNDALEIFEKERLKEKNKYIFDFEYNISENTFFVEINVSNLEDFYLKELNKNAGKEQFTDNNDIKKYIIDLFISSKQLIQPTIYIKKISKTIEDSSKKETTAVKKPRGKK
jgi:hypothetical protein